MHLRTLIFTAACVLLAGVGPAAHADAADGQKTQTPEQVVKQITTQLSNAMENKRDQLAHNKQEMVNLVNKILLPHLDVDYAAILVLGRHARQATPKQRQEFANAFYKSLTSRYAEGLTSYTKGKVTVLPFKGELDPRHTVVRTKVALDNGKDISVDYVFRKTHDGQWKAYDVVIEGVSYITNYRSQVDAQIQKEGIDGLINKLQNQGGEALKKMDKNSGS